MAYPDRSTGPAVTERIRREQIPELVSQLTSVYHRSFETATQPPTPQDEAALIPTLDLHAKREDFDLFGSREQASGRLIGFVYGYRSAPGQYWYQRVTAPLSSEIRQRWFSDAFEIPVLGVLPEYQRRGIGSALLDQLLARRTESTAVLTALQDDRRAVEFYHRRGWSVLLSDFHFGAQTPPYLLLGRELRI
jgi:ribosomal protein S18 acetylase RimI-like enzyme